MKLPLIAEFKKRILRTALYLLGAAAILLLVFAIVFVLFLPKLRGLAEREMYKYGVKAEDMEVGALGSVSMRAMSVPLEKGGDLRIDSLSMRPPLRFWGRTWLGGRGVFYNLRIKKDKLQILIPELHFSGLSLAEKNPHILSHSLQMLLRLQASSLYADKIYVTMQDNAPMPGAAADAADFGDKRPQTLQIEAHLNGFYISGLRGGKISELSYNAMEGQALFSAVSDPVSHAAGSAQSFLHGGGFSAEDLDAAALLALTKKLLPAADAEDKDTEKQNELNSLIHAGELIGKIWLRNLHFVLENTKFGTVRLDIAGLNSRGFSLKPNADLGDLITQIPNAAEKSALHSGKKNGDNAEIQDNAAALEAEKKKIMLHNIQRLIANIAAIDINIQNLRADVSPNVSSLADAAAKTAAAAAAVTAQAEHEHDAGEQRTINELLKEEQALAAQKKKAEYLPPHFKLTFVDFALTSSHWEQMIPYNFYIKIQDLSYIPENKDSAFSMLLQQMGRNGLQFSLLGDIEWKAYDSSLHINKMTANGPDMGSFSLQGKISDIPKSFFSGKADSMETALNSAALNNLEIRMKDEGFIKNIVQWGTTQINITAKELQSVLYDIAVKSPPLLLKNRQEAQNISAILGDFVNHSGSVRIMITAPGGLRFSDIMAGQDDMAAVLDKLQLTADRTPPD